MWSSVGALRRDVLPRAGPCKRCLTAHHVAFSGRVLDLQGLPRAVALLTSLRTWAACALCVWPVLAPSALAVAVAACAQSRCVLGVKQRCWAVSPTLVWCTGPSGSLSFSLLGIDAHDQKGFQ